MLRGARPWGCPLIFLMACVVATGQERVRDRMIEGTKIMSPAGVLVDLQGTYDLRPGLQVDHYFVNQLWGFDGMGNRRLTASGWYARDGGLQRMVLDAVFDDAAYLFDSDWVPWTVAWPMMRIDLHATSAAGDPLMLHIRGVPALNVWFSTEVPFTRPNGNVVSDGDVLTHFGDILWTNGQLTQNLDLMWPVDVGLDALHAVEIDSPPFWQPWFSMEIDAPSNTHGLLQHGDFLSQAGFIVARNQELTALFLPTPGDYGLDAITWSWGCWNWYFSTEIDMPTWFGMVFHGDVLCAQHGWPYMSNEALRANFHPVGPVPFDLGLDAIYMWPSGSIWFSLEEGFMDAEFGWISDGDLLSIEGWVIYRNWDLVRRFQPVDPIADFGLDALFLAPVRRGDMNGDLRIDFDDIDPFVEALSNPMVYYAMYPELDPQVVGDVDYDGDLDFDDIDPFVELLTP